MTDRPGDWKVRDDARLLRFGLIGTIVASICCFTPLPVVLLAAVGLGTWTIHLDRVLLPLLLLALAVTAAGYWRLQRAREDDARR